MKSSPVFQKFELDRKPYKWHSRDLTNGEGAIWDKNHAHQGMEFVYVQQGEGIAIIDQNIIRIQPGAIIYAQPFQMHRILIQSSQSASYIRSKILFEPEVFYPLFRNLPLLQKFFAKLWKERLTTQVVDHSCQRDELDSLFDRFKRDNTLSEEEQQERFSILLICFLQLIRPLWNQAGPVKPEAPRSLNHVEKAFQWIEAHYREPFDLGAMAEALYLTPQHISRLFRTTAGSTISDYLLFRRIREACLLIGTTELPIQEIAMQVGIPNVSRFCQMFKRRIGLTPLQYRSANHAANNTRGI